MEIRQSDKIAVPLTYGILRPVILLPKTTDWTDEMRLRYILTHEFTHIRRFDTLTKLALAAAFCVHWFNPLVWAMYILANRDIELSCDETVIRTLGETIKSAYALTLIELEEKKSRLTPLVNNFSKNATEERIVSIMKIRKFSLPIIVVAVLLVAGITIGFATSNIKAGDEPNAVIDSEPADGTWVSVVNGVSGPIAVDSKPGKLVSVKLSDESKYTPEQWQDILKRIGRGEITAEMESFVISGRATIIPSSVDFGTHLGIELIKGGVLAVGRETWEKGDEIIFHISADENMKLYAGIIPAENMDNGFGYNDYGFPIDKKVDISAQEQEVSFTIPETGEYGIYVRHIKNEVDEVKVTPGPAPEVAATDIGDEDDNAALLRRHTDNEEKVNSISKTEAHNTVTFILEINKKFLSPLVDTNNL